MHLRALFLIPLLSIAFAGCIASQAGPASADGAGSAPEAAPAEFDSDSGGIEGQVLNEELLPVAGASIGLRGTTVVDGAEASFERSALSDAEGSYSLSRIPPGTYDLFANALGYEAKAFKVEVIAGELVRKDIGLEAIPIEGPYDETWIITGSMTYGASWKLTPECIYEPLTGVNPLLKTCGGIRGGGANGEIGVGNPEGSGQGEVLPTWATILVEVTWQQQTPVFGKSLQLDIMFPNITRGANGAANQADPRYFQDPDYDSPTQNRIERPELDERQIPADDQHGNVQARVFTASADLGTWQSAPDVGLMSEQSFTWYVTISYLDPLPEGFSALPDA